MGNYRWFIDYIYCLHIHVFSVSNMFINNTRVCCKNTKQHNTVHLRLPEQHVLNISGTCSGKPEVRIIGNEHIYSYSSVLKATSILCCVGDNILQL